jgi:hypothetical protein
LNGILGAVAGLSARLFIVTVAVASAVLVATWLAWSYGYPRALADVFLWLPISVVTWLLGSLALTSNKQFKPALAYAALTPIALVGLTVLFLLLADQSSPGLFGMIALLTLFDLAQVYVFHLVVGTRPKSRIVSPQLGSG